jgi:polygalacturonase
MMTLLGGQQHFVQQEEGSSCSLSCECVFSNTQGQLKTDDPVMIPTTSTTAEPNVRRDGSRRLCNVKTDYNASGDGKTYDTAAINAALRDCSGVGVVVLPGPNTFLTSGGHSLSSNMGLEIGLGAVLLQTTDQSAGSAAELNCGNASNPNFAGFAPGCAVLSAQNARNVSIYGEGAIRGAGAPETCWNWNGQPFANLLKFQFVDGLRISGVSLVNPCRWTIHPQRCRDVHIHDINISCEPVQYHYNTDGIDPDSCSDVLLEDVDYSCGDDAVAIKSSYPGCQLSKNITIRRLRSGGRGGFTIGSEVQGGAEDITFEDSVSTGVSGIRISQQSQRGGFLRNVWFRNISFDFGNKFAFEKKSFVLDVHQSYAAEDDGKVCPGYDSQPTMTGIHFADLTVVRAPSNLRIGDLGCDRSDPPACTNVTIDRLVLLDAPEPQPLTCSNRPGSQCQGNCSSVHGVIAGVSPPNDSRCLILRE